MWAFGHLEPSNCSSVIGFILLLVFISLTWVYDAIMGFFFSFSFAFWNLGSFILKL
jgi:hypothetical protein